MGEWIKWVTGIGGLTALITVGWSAYGTIDTKLEEVQSKAAAYADAAARASKQVHYIEFWDEKVEQQKRYIRYLRETGAPEHEVMDEAKKLDYYEQEQRNTIKQLSE